MFATGDTDEERSGAFTFTSDNYTVKTVRSGGDRGNYRKVTFNASDSISTASESRPYNIALLPLVAY